MQALYGLLAVTGVVAAIMGIAWLGFRASKREGAAEAERDASEEAREAEGEMTEIILRPPSSEETKDELEKGTF